MAEKKSCSLCSSASKAFIHFIPDTLDSHRLRFLSLFELQDTMVSFSRPVASNIAGVGFTVYSNEEIEKLSVKRIHNTPTLDSFNNPVPGKAAIC